MHYNEGQTVYIKYSDDKDDGMNNNIPREILQNKDKLSRPYKIIAEIGMYNYHIDVPGYHYWSWDESQLQLHYCNDCKYYNTCDKIHCQKEEYMPVTKTKEFKWGEMTWTTL